MTPEPDEAAQQHALSAIRFSSALNPDTVWQPLSNHVDGLHPDATHELTRAVREALDRPHSSPTGLVLSGERGVGKTHMLGWLRQHVQDQGGWFFMPKLIDGRSFWAGAVHGIVHRLLGSDGGQLRQMLDALADATGCDAESKMRLRGNLEVRRHDLDDLVGRVEELDRQVAMECRDTLRALVLCLQKKMAVRDVGYDYLVLDGGIGDSAAAEWGFRERTSVPQQLFGELCRLFALTGPVVLAIDQIDTVIAQSDRADADGLANRLADGLMRMREETTRTVVVVACIPKSWELLRTRAVNSAADRFTVLELSSRMPGASVARAIVENHLGAIYGEIGFVPPYPTWPVLPTAFEGGTVANSTPRHLLRQLEQHVRQSLSHNAIIELTDFDAIGDAAVPVAPLAATEMTALDTRFRTLRADADVTTPLDPQHEDSRMFELLNAALRCYVLERDGDSGELTIDPMTTVQPALHARLRRTLDEATEEEEHWSFRAIAHSHHRAVQTRMRTASLEAGIQPGASTRHLVVLRNSSFSGGPVTRQMLAEFESAQGIAVPVAEDDLRTFFALEHMLGEADAGFTGWLADRRPASRSELLTALFGTDRAARATVGNGDGRTAAVARPTGTGDSGSPDIVDGERMPAVPTRTRDSLSTDNARPSVTPPAPGDQPSVHLGRNKMTDKDLRIPLELLRKHTAVFAGSGSGKTVLLRRLVEEVALHGVSSIVIDTNNDLARLGDAWPAAPAGWETGDRDKATRYLEGTDVVIWTPRREAGRPLALNPLPDFSGVLDDPDEFRTAIDAAVAGIVPRAGLTSRKEPTGKAVLTQALTHFARHGGCDLGEFVELLGDLPDGVSTMRDAYRVAAAMAEELKAAAINDPVFGGAGERLDPGTLFTPAPGKRARISVISCIGLPTDEQRQTFVNQLQLALFAWIKQHPAGDRPLGGLFVLDEAQTFVPSRGTTPASESTLKLAAQARKYGLGMVYATQAPKGLHNQVAGNAATQFIGKLVVQVQMQTAQVLAVSRGSEIADIARLGAGQFYGSTEGTRFDRVDVPMCLSHHPPSALTEEEVIRRARESRDGEE